jgi:hypothetical protein
VVVDIDLPTTLTFAPPTPASACTLSDIASVPLPTPTVPCTVAPTETGVLETGTGLGALGMAGPESHAAPARASPAAITNNEYRLVTFSSWLGSAHLQEKQPACHSTECD